MDKALYDYCISHIIKNSEPGFSFVKEFVGILVKNKNLLQINNIVTYWYVNQGDENTRKSSEDAHRYRGLSWFGRLNYNYAGKYYLMFTFRAD